LEKVMLMGDYRQKRVHAATAKTYREMILVRDDVKEFKDMQPQKISKCLVVLIGKSDVCVAGDLGNLDQTGDCRLKTIKHISNEIILKVKNGANFDFEKELKGLLSVKPRSVSSFSLEKVMFVSPETLEILIKLVIASSMSLSSLRSF
jgi:hypothetical protein